MSGGRPSSVQQNVPAWLIFGMFFVVMPMSALFIVERRDGTLARLAGNIWVGCVAHQWNRTSSI